MACFRKVTKVDGTKFYINLDQVLALKGITIEEDINELGGCIIEIKRAQNQGSDYIHTIRVLETAERILDFI